MESAVRLRAVWFNRSFHSSLWNMKVMCVLLKEQRTAPINSWSHAFNASDKEPLPWQTSLCVHLVLRHCLHPCNHNPLVLISLPDISPLILHTDLRSSHPTISTSSSQHKTNLPITIHQTTSAEMCSKSTTTNSSKFGLSYGGGWPKEKCRTCFMPYSKCICNVRRWLKLWAKNRRLRRHTERRWALYIWNVHKQECLSEKGERNV